MTPVDAQFYWMSAILPSDQFLLYAFAGEPPDFDAAVAAVRRRAQSCPALTVRLDDRGVLTYPRWVSADPPSPRVHDLSRPHWAQCLQTVARLGEDPVDATVSPWRLHLFPGVRDLPATGGTGTVAVLQVAHALADGARATQLASWLFGRPAPVPAVTAHRRGWLPWRALQAARAHRRLDHDIRSGALAPPAEPRPALVTNSRPSAPPVLRTLVRRRDQLGGPTVTVAVLGAVATALTRQLGAVIDTLGAEVPMAKPFARHANNHFHNVAVGLHPRLSPPERARRIAADLAAGRARADHPATVAANRAFATVPAALLRWGVSRFDPDLRSESVAGNTVVSSVHRGPADLRFGTTPVVLTSGYPALSPMMGLTHGVHGIGDTIAISVHTAAPAIVDVDAYLEHLDAALTRP
ncbi:MAG TPA: WS/DGAT domain-containing protein [Mycolicibacillus parakoreensis]|nr:WS/DGAT domain-containing protein [Mycolicibacillus parakoreensis]